MSLANASTLNKRSARPMKCRRCGNSKASEIELYAIRLGNGTFADSPECRDMLACERACAERAQAAAQ